MIRKAFVAAVLALGLIATGTASAGSWYGGYYHTRHYHDHDGDALAAGILFGAAVGLALSDAWYDDTYYYRPYYYRPYAYPRYYYYAPPRVVYAPAPVATAPACVMTREYTTTVTIEGREREAYGTACMQPDGSWTRGPAKLVPDF